MFQQMSHFKQRLIVGLSVLVFLLITIYLSAYPFFRPLFALIGASIIASAVWEYYQIAKAKGFQPLESLGITCTVAYVLAVFLNTQTQSAHYFPEIILLLMLMSAFVVYFIKGANPFLNISITLFAFIYLTIPLSCLIAINYFDSPAHPQDGRWWLLYLILVTKMTDTGGYFCGKIWGEHKMAPFISPGKTWEGAIGGFIGSLAASLMIYGIVNYWLDSPIQLGLTQSFLLGSLISIVAQFGDLAESLLKRDVGVKDSNQLPGLGGVLDIVDSLIFTAPLLYLFLNIVSAK